MEDGSEDQVKRIYICGHLGRTYPHHRHRCPHPILPTGNEHSRTGRVKMTGQQHQLQHQRQQL